MTPERWQQVKAILDDALAVPSPDRDRLLTQRCGSDQDLRAEVESLLARQDVREDILGSSVGLAVHALAATTESSGVDHFHDEPVLALPTVLAGRYCLLREIGAGGMGKVYESRDDVLGRLVAVKVLPNALASSPERQQRFSREARVVASLSHPHICAVYDTGIHEGLPFLVMELLDGPTLSERLARGPLTLREALHVATEIIEALAYAHKRGVVHRDLKPANIKLTSSGAKLLDFGLAKVDARRDAPFPSGTTAVGTHGELGTVTANGAIVGTLRYMAPEQLEGRHADARSDLFAFGAILYEMVTGAKAFAGPSHAGLVASILRDEPPPISVSQPLAPEALDRIVRACLAKDPEARWQSAQDVATALGTIDVGTARAPTEGRRTLARVAGVSVVVALAAILAWLAFRLPAPTPATAAPVRRLAVAFPANMKGPYWGPILSPDGSLIAFVAAQQGESLLIWLRPLASTAYRPIAGTAGANRFFWAPDGAQIAFFAEGQLKRVHVSGGAAERICDVPSAVWGGTWNREGTIVFSGGPGRGLFRVAAAGGVPMALTASDAKRGEQGHLWPQFLPDGRHFLYTVASPNQDVRGIYIGSTEGGPGRRLNGAWSAASYAPEGYIVYAKDQLLLAQRFDPATGQLGDEYVVGEGATSARFGFFSVAPDTIAYLWAPAKSRLVWLDRAGRQIGTVGPEADLSGPVISPDGMHVAANVADPQAGGGSDVWIFDVTSNASVRLTRGAPAESDAVWSPDSERVAFSRDGLAIYEKPAGGGGDERQLMSSHGGEVYPNDWSPDGSTIVYSDFSATWADLWLLRLSDPTRPVVFRQTPFSEHQARFSPDGKWIAYASDESGQVQVYIQALPPSTARVSVSAEGGSQPMWRKDGRELYYLAPDGTLMTSDVDFRKSPPTVGTPHALFRMRLDATSFHAVRNDYSVSTDGQRFLVNRPMTEGSWEFSLVFNWLNDRRINGR